MAYLVGLLLLIEMVSCGTQRNPTAGSTKGTIVLEVVYEKAPKLAEAMYMDRMMASVFSAQKLVVQQDLARVGDRWQGELEVDQGSYTVVLEAYKLSKLVRRGSTDVNIVAGKTQPVSIRMTPTNRPPISRAGSDQRVGPDAVVSLDGRGSTDPDRDRLSYRWSGPNGILLSDSTSAQPQFLATAAGTYTFSLVVSDGTEKSEPDFVVVTVRDNHPPVANVVLETTGQVGRTVQLDATGSNDPDGDPLVYKWHQGSGAIVDLNDATSDRPSFTPPSVGIYLFTLVVTDGYVDSVPDTAIVRVAGGQTEAVQSVGEAQENIGEAQVIGTIQEGIGDAEIIGNVQE